MSVRSDRETWTAESSRQALLTAGYVSLPGIVPQRQVAAALHTINRALGDRGMEPALLAQFRSRSYTPEEQRAPAITELFTQTPLQALAAAWLGQVSPVESGQIALRFPNTAAPRPPRAHLDGMHTPTNGVPPGEIRNFTALVGVFLSDVPAPDCGNFSVWPGSHLRHAEHFRAHGPGVLLHGMPPLELGSPRQLTARAGDAVLCHYLLGHGVAENASPHVRYAVFFRLTRADHAAVRWEAMCQPWLEWPGLAEPAR